MKFLDHLVAANLMKNAARFERISPLAVKSRRQADDARSIRVGDAAGRNTQCGSADSRPAFSAPITR